MVMACALAGVEVRCWRCNRKLAELSAGAAVTITLVCSRCHATTCFTIPAAPR